MLNKKEFNKQKLKGALGYWVCNIMKEAYDKRR